MKRVMERLKSKWGIRSNWDFLLIMLVFSLAGMMVSVLRKPVFALLGVTPQTAFWIKAAIYIPLIFPLYQLSLILFGFLLGQFRFFWEKEKQLAGAVRKLFLKAAAKISN